MPEVPAQKPSRDVVCPHCKKPFTAEAVLSGGLRNRGFKCPHCRLFVPVDRAAKHS